MVVTLHAGYQFISYHVRNIDVFVLSLYYNLFMSYMICLQVAENSICFSH